jgi:hypothetical protein
MDDIESVNHGVWDGKHQVVFIPKYRLTEGLRSGHPVNGATWRPRPRLTVGRSGNRRTRPRGSFFGHGAEGRLPARPLYY